MGYYAPPKFFDNFDSNLCNLRYLRIQVELEGGVMPDVRRACSGKLNSLHLDGGWLHKGDVDAIAAHCVGLETLKMWLWGGMNMPEVWHSGSGRALSAVWRTLGPTLRNLSLGCLELVDWPDCRPVLQLTGGVA